MCVSTSLPLQPNELEAITGQQGCYGDQWSQRWATSVRCFSRQVFLIVTLSPVISSALMIKVDFLFTLFPNVSKHGTWTYFEKDLIPLLSVQLPVLSHVHSRPSFCVSQQELGVYARGKLGNLEKRLTPVLLLLPLSMASLSIWTCSVSTAPFSWLPYQ